MIFDKLLQNYETFKDTRITKRRWSDSHWKTIVSSWEKIPHVRIQTLGETYEGRPIQEIRFGNGPIKICAWSQMHGNEATATMALCDLFNYLSMDSPHYGENLHQKISLFCIPYLNADGAVRWQRETALGIDMNRDAQTCYSPEAKLLSDWADKIQPDFAFNLHDQNRLYSAGNNDKQTQFAFLATTGDEAGTWTASRSRAAKLANRLTRLSKTILGDGVAKWTDEYNPRAFGDAFQSRGYGLLLFEAGGAGWDLEKQTLRKLHACLLIDALYSIADETYLKEDITTYEALPTNERAIFDIKLCNVQLDAKANIRADVGINLMEIPEPTGEITYAWIVEEIGDLAYMHAMHTIQGQYFELIGDNKIALQENFSELSFLKDGKIAFDIRTFTAQINHTL